MSAKKKQHYVPRLYLEEFTTDKNKKINVYDKSRKMFRVNQSLMNVASENYFYDFDLQSIYDKGSEKVKADFHEKFGQDATPRSVRDKHLVEEFFSDNVEGGYSELLDKLIELIDSVKDSNDLNNCICLSEKEKEEFSYYLVIQLLRGKYLRNLIRAIYSKMINIDISKDKAILEQIKCIMDNKMINMAKQMLLQQKWVIYINKTDINLYTSDHPFIKQPHISKPGVKCNGLNADTVEYVFPITKSSVLVIYSENAYEVMQLKYGKDIYPDDMKPEDRKFREMNNRKQVEYYNRLQIAYSINEIYISDDSCDFIEKILEENTEYLNKEYITSKPNKDE